MAGFTHRAALAVMISIVIFLSRTNPSKAWLLSRRPTTTVHSSSDSTTTAIAKLFPQFGRTQSNLTDNDTQKFNVTLQPYVEQQPHKWVWTVTDKLNYLKTDNQTKVNDSTKTLPPDLNITTTATASTIQNFTLNLTDSLMKKCFKTNGHFRVSAKEGIISMVYHPAAFFLNRDLMSCEVEVTVSPDHVAVLQIEVKPEGCGFLANFLVYDTSTKEPLSRSLCGLLLPKTFSKSNSLTIRAELPLMVAGSEHRVVFRFKGIAIADKPGIELYYLTTTSGETLTCPQCASLWQELIDWLQ